MARVELTALVQDLRQLTGGSAAVVKDGELLSRFVREQDGRAFATLVRRHAALVMGVCRRALGHEQDAEDAFQATFLVLARQAARIRQGESLPAWLHGVAQRVACNARRELARQRVREAHGARSEAVAVEELSWREVQAALDEEVGRLPEIYRSVFILCVMQERARAEVARELGIKEGTVSSRLAKAKERLQARLERRGVSLGVALAGVGSEAVGAASVRAVMGVVLERGAAVAGGVSLGGWLTKVVAAVVVMGMLVVGSVARNPRNDKQEGRQGNSEDLREVQGRVLDPDNKPLRGANVVVRVSSPDHHVGGSAVASANTDVDGRFRLPYPASPHHGVTVVATAAGLGPAWAKPTARDAGDLTLRLVKDHPIIGRIVDLEGRPVPNARLRVQSLGVPESGDLQIEMTRFSLGKSRFRTLRDHAFPTATTDAKGNVHLTGLGKERLVAIVIEGDTIASTHAWLFTRDANVPLATRSFPAYHARFTHLAAPTRPLVGVVRDRVTHKPIAGVTIRADRLAGQDTIGLASIIETKTDQTGRYRLVGLPKGEGNAVVVEPPAHLPYLGVRLEVADPVGGGAVDLDVALRPGVWVEGRITDEATGKPVPHASVQYYPRIGNAYLPEVVGKQRASLHNPVRTASADGRYRVAILPGDGIVAVAGRGEYLTLREQPDVSPEDYEGTVPYSLFEGRFHRVARVSPAKDAVRMARDVTLSRGETLKGKLVDPDGKAVVGVWSYGLDSGWAGWRGPMESAEFTLGAFNRKKPRYVQFGHPERNLVAVLKTLKEGEKVVVVPLQKGGTLTGQLVDEDGKPRPGIRLSVHLVGEDATIHALNGFLRTDEKGKFRIPGVLPGVKHLVNTSGEKGSLGTFKLGVGETKDLGKVQLRPN